MKTAIVTGAARGIGLAITHKLLAADYRVAMLDIDWDTLQSSRKLFNTEQSILALHCDVSDQSMVQASVNAVIKQFGCIDVLINNAGIATFKPFMQTHSDEWLRIMAVNLNGAFYCSQACVPHMLKKSGGNIVNITSISGLRASTLRAAYGTSKAALAHLSKQMAAELGDQGIRVNAIAPGPVDTAMAKKVHSSAIRADYHNAIPLNRYGTEEEIANAVVFLCSEQSGYINGQEIAVDGGFAATGVGLPTLRNSQ